MRPDGSEQTRLTSLREGVTSLLWSPDGDRIAFIDAKQRWLWLVNADGSDLLGLENTSVSAFTWAPDSKALGYSLLGTTSPDGQLYGTQINIVRVSNTLFYTAIYTGTQYTWHMDWSPDGSEIAFPCDKDLCAISPEGTGLRTITPLGPTSLTGLDWSPNSAQLAVTSDALYLIDRDGSRQQKIFPPFSDQGRPHNPQWSPDGSHVGVNFFRPQVWEVWVVDLNGGSISLGEGGGYSWSR